MEYRKQGGDLGDFDDYSHDDEFDDYPLDSEADDVSHEGDGYFDPALNDEGPSGQF